MSIHALLVIGAEVQVEMPRLSSPWPPPAAFLWGQQDVHKPPQDTEQTTELLLKC